VSSGTLEVRDRKSGERGEVPIAEAVSQLAGLG
jgi:hypothetical protein